MGKLFVNADTMDAILEDAPALLANLGRRVLAEDEGVGTFVIYNMIVQLLCQEGLKQSDFDRFKELAQRYYILFLCFLQL
jgi:hypothetical protein